MSEQRAGFEPLPQPTDGELNAMFSGYEISLNRSIVMNINDLTYGQILEIVEKFGGIVNRKPDMLAHLIGKKVLIRDHKAGLFLTTLVDVDGSQWIGGESRKIHYWAGAGAVEGIAETGIDLLNSRITVKTSMSSGKELIQICPVSDEVYKLIMEAQVWNPK